MASTDAMTPTVEQEVYSIFPKNPGESRVVGDFEFAFTRVVNNENHFTYRYIPRPGTSPNDYVISNSRYFANSSKIDLSQPQPHVVHNSYYRRRRRNNIHNPAYLLSVWNWPEPVKKALEEAYRLDHGVWKKSLAAKRKLLDRAYAESIGITLSEYRKQVAELRKASRVIKKTSDEMEVSMYLVGLKDEIDSVLGAMKHGTVSVKKLWVFRTKMNGFSGPIWRKARGLGLKQEQENVKKNKKKK